MKTKEEYIEEAERFIAKAMDAGNRDVALIMVKYAENYHQQKLAEEKSCNHEFDDPVYNQGEELMGYACSKCGEIEYI